MKILSNMKLGELEKKWYEDGRNSGYHCAIDSLVKAIESGDKVVLGNGVAFIGINTSEPITIVGDNAHISNSSFSIGKKSKKGGPCLNIVNKL